MAILKNDVLKYFADVWSHYAVYHNHKEASAWAATAIYLVVVIQIAATVNVNPSEFERVLRAVAIVLLGVSVSVYTATQFKLRSNAVNYIAACQALSVEYLSEKQEDIDENLFRLMESSDAGHHSPHILPKIVLDKARQFEGRGQKMRVQLENTMYFSLAAIALAGLGVVLSR